MNKLKKFFLVLGIVLAAAGLISCFSVPGSIDKNGNVTPPYSSEIKLEVLEGKISIIPTETDTGTKSIKAKPAKEPVSKTQDNIYLSAHETYTYSLAGNHSMMFSVRTLDETAVFQITWNGEITEYTIYKTDVLDKIVYIRNF